MNNKKLNLPEGGLKVASVPVLGIAVKAKGAKMDGVYCIKEHAIPNRHYSIACPKCGKPIVFLADSSKAMLVKHEECKVRIKVRIIQTTSTTNEEDDKKDLGSTPVDEGYTPKIHLKQRKPSNGKLVWWGLLRRKKYVLCEGDNYVGRRDKTLPSDLSLNDDYASVRSLCISVKSSEQDGCSFHLSVQKATNPVLVAGKEYSEGQGVDLNNGDIITMGNTKLTFKLTKK